MADPKFIARITCICLSCTINMVLLLIVICKIYIQKEKKINICFGILITYLIFGFLTPFYNIIYRFIITEELCFVSDSIEEVLVVITRSIILFFYMIRLKTVFQGSFGEINDKAIKGFIIIMISYSIIIPSLWIPTQTVTPYVTTFGIYCWNTGNLLIVLIYYAIDFILTFSLTFMFVHRLYILHSKDTGKENNVFKSILIKTVILTSMSVISTWIIMYPSYLSATDFLSEIRWFYPLDYGINGLCLFFMFKWNWNCIKSQGTNKPKVPHIDVPKLSIAVHSTSPTMFQPYDKAIHIKYILNEMYGEHLASIIWIFMADIDNDKNE